MNKGTTLSEGYSKAKRYLVFFSGLLVLALIVGVTLDDKQSLFPFKITNPEALHHVLFVIVIYYLSQAVLFWASQTEDTKSLIYYRIDYFFSISIGLLSVIIYLYGTLFKIIAAWLTTISLPSILDSTVFLSLLSFLLTVVVAIITFIAVARTVQEAVATSKMRRAETEQELTELLISGNWILQFNPKNTKGFKEISFLENREVGTGRNNNEHAWAMKGNFLEIYNSQDVLFSRFSYKAEDELFHHTNDADTISKNQKIIPLEKWDFEKREVIEQKKAQ